MSAPTRPTVTASVVTPTLRARARLARPLIILVIVVLAVLGAGALLPRLGEDPRVLSPTSTMPDGAQALVRVMERRGIDVVSPDGPADALARAERPGTTLVVVFPARMQPDVAQALAGAPNLVLVGTEQSFGPVAGVSGLTPDAQGEQPPSGTSAEAGPGCSADSGQRAGSVTAGAYGVRADDTWQVCFPLGTATAAGAPALHAYAQKQSAGSFRAVIADSRLLRNSAVAEFGNAALAINAIARTPHVVWYIADYADSMTDVPTPTPAWMIPSLIVLGGAGLVAAMARGRRLGRLVPEDLPSAVPATETVVGRGRLLRRSRDRGHAALALRTATATRLAARLGVPPGSGADELRDALARAGIDPGRAQALLWGPPPTTDRALVDLADALSDLEEDLRHD